MARFASTTLILFGLCLSLSASSPASADVDSSVSLTTLVEAAREHHPTLAKRPLLAKSLKLQNEQMNRA